MEKNSLQILDHELAILYRRITSITTHHKIGNLDRSAYLLLHQITTYETAGVKALADELRLDISTVSRQATALEQKGYVNKIQNPADGRASLLKITDLGRKELMGYKQERLNRLEKIFEKWSGDECQLFGQLLKKFNQSVIEETES